MSVVLDVGANEGQTIFDIARADLGTPEILAFEPNPTCAYFLQKLIESNAWHHVSVFPIALSDSSRCLYLEYGPELDSGATLVPMLRPGVKLDRRQLVPCFSFDALVRDGTVQVKPGFLMKIDVEGAELDVLRGALSTLHTNRPTVLCEVLWAHCNDRLEFNQKRNDELLKLLREADYELFRVVLTHDQHRLLGLESITELPNSLYTRQNAHQCDYLFLPREHSAKALAEFRVQ